MNLIGMHYSVKVLHTVINHILIWNINLFTYIITIFKDHIWDSILLTDSKKYLLIVHRNSTYISGHTLIL